MQLRKTVWMLTALSAMSLVMTGCPEEGEDGVTCASDSECAETEVCHPSAKVCVATCTGAAECPAEEKVCAPFSGSSSSVCQCSTNEICEREAGPDMICSDLTKLCTLKCTTNADCATGQTCEVSSGQCRADGTNPTTCTGTSQSSCDYGEYCSNSQCTAAPLAPTTCENFPSSDRPNWSAASSNGPVIYSVGFLRYEVNSSFCAGTSPDAFIVSVRAYRPDTDWPDTRAGLSGFFYVTTATNEFDIINSGLLVPNTGYNRTAANRKDAEFQVYLCRPSNSSTIQVGFYFTGGNPVCQNISK